MPRVASEKRGGRKLAETAQPGLLAAVEKVVEQHTAGSPVDENILWTNRSPADIAEEVRDEGYEANADTIRRILTEALHLSRRAARKDETACDFAERDEQFRHIAALRRKYERNDWPILSIDTKKKEILGDFYHCGRAYTNGRVIVEDHDFVTSEQRLVPFGVYDVRRNEGLMRLACGADTPELACDAIWSWWERLGREHYYCTPRLLLLCDCGGSNGNRQHRFKQELCRLAADMLCDIEVAHYPPGCSKYNPIEHRLFCHVSRSLRGVVLKTIQVARRFIARTSSATGLHVVAEIARRRYQRGIKATREFLDHNPIQFSRFLPQLNYTAPWFVIP
jgi:Rhodopirellula transposase DDE domain